MSDAESTDISEEQDRTMLEVLADHDHWELRHYGIGNDIIPIQNPWVTAGEVQALADQRLGDTEDCNE